MTTFHGAVFTDYLKELKLLIIIVGGDVVYIISRRFFLWGVTRP